MRSRTLILLLCAAALVIGLTDAGAAQSPVRADRMGVAHIAHPSMRDPSERYASAVLIGAGWHRFPVYWSDIERTPGVRVWDSFDRIVTNDVRHGLQTNLILLNVPDHARFPGNIGAVFAPVFADGTDSPAPGKPLNPNNLWGTFVAEAVRRYMPGGDLARRMGWSGGQGVRVWEAWNEPDLAMFWGGTPEEYARLLKVTYLTARHVDPEARVMTAGFAYADPSRGDWLARILDIYAADPAAPAHNWYMDMVALHTYVDPYRTALLARQTRALLARYGLTRPIWFNETGVPVWDDYPGETWTAGMPGARWNRRTMRGQAHYVIQSTVMGWAEGADVMMVHQLYDDCAASPVGTDFPPHNGGLCTGALNLCSGEAFGLFRNPRTADCFRQHPQPGTPRPAAAAYYRLASIFGGRAFALAGGMSLPGGGRAYVFHAAPPLTGLPYDPARIGRDAALALGSGATERIWVLWNSGSRPIEIGLPAVGATARLVTLANDARLAPQDGRYTFSLPPVDPAAYPGISGGELANIDGEPHIVIESALPGWSGGETLLYADGTPRSPLTNPIGTPTPIPPTPIPSITPTFTYFDFTPTPPAPTAAPTLDPALDTAPPIPRMTLLPDSSPPRFTVSWDADDASGIAEFVVWVRIDGGYWQPWLSTAERSAVYEGAPGQRIAFALWARDLAGNWSSNLELTPMATTTISG